MTEVRQQLLDGVPVVWVPDDGPCRAVLEFDVGWADEPIAWRGVTHLAEHLVLSGIPSAECTFNGETAAHRTTFWASGEPDEVGAFIVAVCERIDAADYSTGFDQQLGLLQAEASRRGGHPLATAHDQVRWGGVGLGGSQYTEIGVHWLSPSDVGTWARRRFTAGGAALVGSGPMPTPLRLPLPAGLRIPRELPREQVKVPSFTVRAGAPVSFSAVVPGDASTLIGVSLLQRRLMEVLRHRAAISYHVGVDTQRVADQKVRLLVDADAVPGKEQEVADRMLGAVRELTAELVPEEDVRALDESYRTSGVDVEADVWRRADEARRRGRTVRVEDDWDRHVARGAEGVRFWMASMAATSLWMVPESVRVTKLPEAWFDPRTEVVGRRYDLVDRKQRKQFVIVGDAGIAHADDESGGTVAVAWVDCGAVLVLSDGVRVVLGNDGSSIEIDPRVFVDAAELARDIDARAPQGTLCLPRGGLDAPPAPEPGRRKRRRFGF